MAYSKTFRGTDEQEVMRQATEFVKELDEAEQGHVWGVSQHNGEYLVVVKWWGLD